MKDTEIHTIDASTENLGWVVSDANLSDLDLNLNKSQNKSLNKDLKKILS